MTESEMIVATNRRARFEYHLEDTYEAGVVLTGTEVKSLRAGRASLADAFARIENGEVWLYHLHIPPYEAGNIFNHDTLRKRKLLLHRGEIRRLFGKAQLKVNTMVPLRLYFNHGVAKVELAFARRERHDYE